MERLDLYKTASSQYQGGHRLNQVTQIRGSLFQVNAALSLFPIHAYALFTESLLFEN